MSGKDNGSLAVQIQREVVDSSIPISDILRKAKILASLLNNDGFKRWVDAELGGYDPGGDVPDYRDLQPLNRGTFSGALGQIVRNVPIPLSHLPSNLRKSAEQMAILQGVKEIETTAARSTDENSFQFQWPPEAVMAARDHVRMDDGSVLVEAWKPLTKGQLEGILDQVRNRLLDFLLELQQIDPEVMESEDAIRAVPSAKVQNIFVTKILGGQNIVATGTDFTQKVTQSVKVGDTQSLCGHLRSLGLREDAIVELQAALTQDGERPPQKLGGAVKSWLGKMAAKAVDGTWNVATNTALDLLKTALFAYYGWG